jgi:hypothetical protein
MNDKCINYRTCGGYVEMGNKCGRCYEDYVAAVLNERREQKRFSFLMWLFGRKQTRKHSKSKNHWA